MEYTSTGIEDVRIIKPGVFTDDRGFFMESFRTERLAKILPDVQFVQDNVSRSKQNVLRGLHYQIEQPQDKLIMVLQGTILDIAVDLRQQSPTFGKHVRCTLSANNKRQLLVPKGFAHGFVVVEGPALVHYKCSDYYHAEGERGLRWNDPALGIDWNVQQPLLSAKDQQHPALSDIPDTDLF